MEPAGGRRGQGGARPSPPAGWPGGGGGREASPTAPPLPGGASPSPARAVSKKLGRKGESLSASDTGEALGPARLPRCRRRRARLTLLRAAAAAAAAARAPPFIPPQPHRLPCYTYTCQVHFHLMPTNWLCPLPGLLFPLISPHFTSFCQVLVPLPLSQQGLP